VTNEAPPGRQRATAARRPGSRPRVLGAFVPASAGLVGAAFATIAATGSAPPAPDDVPPDPATPIGVGIAFAIGVAALLALVLVLPRLPRRVRRVLGAAGRLALALAAAAFIAALGMMGDWTDPAWNVPLPSLVASLAIVAVGVVWAVRSLRAPLDSPR
jgi:hypothetical protein